jgi:hypothetical protein
MTPPYKYLVLDAYPLGNATMSLAKHGVPPTEAQACRQWMEDCQSVGITFLVPAIAYYEEVRELYQRQAPAKIARLEAFCFNPARFIPLTLEHLTEAARLWGHLRRIGQATTDRHALDGDAIFAAQVLSLGLLVDEYTVVTRNPAQLVRFALPAEQWENIRVKAED